MKSRAEQLSLPAVPRPMILPVDTRALRIRDEKPFRVARAGQVYAVPDEHPGYLAFTVGGVAFTAKSGDLVEVIQ